jgi:hypothetical protein
LEDASTPHALRGKLVAARRALCHYHKN